MFRPGVNGIGNLFMQLTQVDTVSEKFLSDGSRKKYIKLKNIRVVPDDYPLLSVTPSLIIGSPVHTRIRDLIEPTDEMKRLIEKHSYIVHGVSLGIQIRRCGLSKTLSNELTPDTSFCTDEALEKFHGIVENADGPVFVTSDCHVTKHDFKNRWPDKVRILDEIPTHTSSVNESDPWVAFLEFFLLSKCPAVYITGGETEHRCHMSTFGYMAAVYGDKPHAFVFNS